jgi:hypothetical protein
MIYCMSVQFQRRPACFYRIGISTSLSTDQWDNFCIPVPVYELETGSDRGSRGFSSQAIWGIVIGTFWSVNQWNTNTGDSDLPIEREKLSMATWTNTICQISTTQPFLSSKYMSPSVTEGCIPLLHVPFMSLIHILIIAVEMSTLYSHEHIPLLFPTRFVSGTHATHSHHSKAYASWSSWTSHCRECIPNACQTPMDSIRRDRQEIW